jgi:hypothetical protein
MTFKNPFNDDLIILLPPWFSSLLKYFRSGLFASYLSDANHLLKQFSFDMELMLEGAAFLSIANPVA